MVVKKDKKRTTGQARTAAGQGAAIPAPSVKTPQETAKAQAEANAYIRQREKMASKLNISSREAARILTEQDPAEVARRQLAQQEATTMVQTNAAQEAAAANLAANPDLLTRGSTTGTEGSMLQPIGTNVVEGATTLGAGVAGGIAGAIGGAGTGAVIGSAVPVVGTAAGATAGAAIGGAAGFIGGVITKITAEKRQNVKEANTVSTAAQKNIQVLINQANSGKPVTWAEWDVEIANLNAADRNFKDLTKTQLDRMLSGGFDEYSKLIAYQRRLPLLEADFRNALISPNPNRIVPITEEILE